MQRLFWHPQGRARGDSAQPDVMVGVVVHHGDRHGDHAGLEALGDLRRGPAGLSQQELALVGRGRTGSASPRRGGGSPGPPCGAAAVGGERDPQLTAMGASSWNAPAAFLPIRSTTRRGAARSATRKSPRTRSHRPGSWWRRTVTSATPSSSTPRWPPWPPARVSTLTSRHPGMHRRRGGHSMRTHKVPQRGH